MRAIHGPGTPHGRSIGCSSHSSAIDADDRPGHKRGLLGAHESDDLGDFLGTAEPLYRQMVLEVILQLLRVLLLELGKVTPFGINRARRHCGYDYGVLRDLPIDSLH